MRSKLRSDYENWAGHLLQDSINGITRSVTELEEMLQQEWRPAGYELMLVSSADFLSPERIEQLTDQIRQCLSGQEALYQFKYDPYPYKRNVFLFSCFPENSDRAGL